MRRRRTVRGTIFLAFERALVFVRRPWLWLHGVRVGKGLHLEGLVCVGYGENVRLGDNVRLGKDMWLGAFGTGRLVIGSNTYVGRLTIILAYDSVEIGDDCLISPFCYIADVNHGRAAGTLIRQQPLEPKPIRIGNDVWIGAGVSVLPGVTIGDGAVIGARAVVSKDIPPNAVAVGVPAKVVHYRTPTPAGSS
jgi:acetyltransferase-like isoleucine patch superfamily enzyme